MCYTSFYLSADGFLFVRICTGRAGHRGGNTGRCRMSSFYKEVPNKWLLVQESR